MIAQDYPKTLIKWRKKNPTLIRFVYKAIATGKLQHKYAMNEADEK